jgi:hypothetical protein
MLAYAGALDDTGEEGGGVPAPPVREGSISLLQWLRDLRTTDPDHRYADVCWRMLTYADVC